VSIVIWMRGGVHGTALQVSAKSSYYATGSDSGMVNIYSTETVKNLSSSRSLSHSIMNTRSISPLKTLGNLTTAIHNIQFNCDNQIIAFASRHNKDSLRLAHLPSMTVFANWPTSSTPLHYVTSLAFSPSSGYLVVGNDRGKALLYRLHHYQAT